jgi:hypothetical protein
LSNKKVDVSKLAVTEKNLREDVKLNSDLLAKKDR